MEQNTSINVTESAQKRIQNLLPEYESNAFRVYVTGGGCSGFQYGFKFDSEEAFDDDVIDFGHFRVLLDSLSYPLEPPSFLKKNLPFCLDIDRTLT